MPSMDNMPFFGKDTKDGKKMDMPNMDKMPFFGKDDKKDGGMKMPFFN